ncbi:MAG: transglutaminase-like cysteine peptidase [Alphaproteobacteria bacterium]|nr:transglutaminase-like cysteine peptidase [Alphaproteobacteria bacterium]MBO6629047.1 transglutaminase-like cysteine peptidase [Alphaproteobacteria bacterium]
MTRTLNERQSDFVDGVDHVKWLQSSVAKWAASTALTLVTFIVLMIASAYFGVGVASELPRGYFTWCQTDTSNCPAVEPQVVPYTYETANLLEMARSERRFAIRYRADDIDSWSYPSRGWGDCEDIAIWFRSFLHQNGVPMGAMRFAVGRTWNGLHVWLEVMTDRGPIAIDQYEIATRDRFRVKFSYGESYDCDEYGCAWRGNTLYPSRESVSGFTQDRR